MSEVILNLSPPQKKAIEVSGFGNLLKINKIHIYRDLCNEIARSYDKEKKAFNINGKLYIAKKSPNEKVHDNDSETRTDEDFVCTSEEVHSITSTEQSADITLQERILESIQTLQDNFNNFTKDFWPRMRSLILHCMENDSKCPERKDTTHVFEDVEQEQIDPREHVSNHNEESYINQNENMTCATKETSNQTNQSRKRLIGHTGRTYKPTNQTDFIYETRGKKKDIIRTQAQTKKTIVYIKKEDLTQQIIDKGPLKNALRGQKKKKTNGETQLKNSEELTKKEDPFITYINNTEDNKVMVHIEEVEVKRIKMKVLTQPDFLNNDVMDAYIQCLHYKEKGIRGDGKAFLEMAIKIGLLNVEGAHVEASKPRDKRWIRDITRDYLAFDMIFLPINIKDTHWYLAVLNAKRREVQILDSLAKPISKDRPDLRRVKEVKTFRHDLAGILINSELNNIKDRPLVPTTT
uniref:Ubiquitin-like protease family profile domain-containing protein n=1 Tax=Oryza sativa subsp. indica TaxID=39946 RepID=C5NNM9_ORYSI|nr:hypothetical protein [Oryza sativa Indica Group]